MSVKDLLELSDKHGFCTFFIINLIVLIINLISVFATWLLKNSVNKNFEKYKNELQLEYLKCKLKTDRSFTIYPQLFFEIKNVEASLARIKILREKNATVPQQEFRSAENDLMKFNNFLCFNLLFVTNQLSNKGIVLKDLISKYLYQNSSPETYDQINKLIDEIASLMKNELGVIE